MKCKEEMKSIEAFFTGTLLATTGTSHIIPKKFPKPASKSGKVLREKAEWVLAKFLYQCPYLNLRLLMAQ